MSDTNVNIGESLIDISANRTLIAKKFTVEDTPKPDVVHGLQTLEQVFQHYRPTLSFRFEDADGFTKSEDLSFNSLDDFSLNGITRQSNFLNGQIAKKKNYLKLARQLKTNQQLQEVLANSDKRKAFEGMIKAMINDLKNLK